MAAENFLEKNKGFVRVSCEALVGSKFQVSSSKVRDEDAVPTQARCLWRHHIRAVVGRFAPLPIIREARRHPKVPATGGTEGISELEVRIESEKLPGRLYGTREMSVAPPLKKVNVNSQSQQQTDESQRSIFEINFKLSGFFAVLCFFLIFAASKILLNEKTLRIIRFLMCRITRPSTSPEPEVYGHWNELHYFHLYVQTQGQGL